VARNPYTIPRNDDVVAENRHITRPWSDFFAALAEGNADASATAATVELTDQGASISATAIPLQTVYQGTYRVSWYAQITTVGTVSSSLTVTLDWVKNGVTQTNSGAAVTGNTLATHQTLTRFIDTDGGTTAR